MPQFQGGTYDPRKDQKPLSSAINSVSSSVSNYVVNPGKDFSRNRKLPADKLISFLIAEGSSTTKNELLDFFGMSGQSPTSSAFFQQRARLRPEALKAVFDAFTGTVPAGDARYPGYRIVCGDAYRRFIDSAASFDYLDRVKLDIHGGILHQVSADTRF